MHVSVCPRAFGNHTKQLTGHEFCTVWADKCLVHRGVYPPPPLFGQLSLGDNPCPGWGGNVISRGGGGSELFISGPVQLCKYKYHTAHFEAR